jgi:quercetin dioxygenase-like cupin family protein
VKIHRGADEAATPAGDEHFTGRVWMSQIFQADAPGGMNSHDVIFEPSARTHWHSHPDGQVLIVTAGRGRTQAERGALTAIRAGDAVFVSAAERHWHGADPDSFMTHISVTGEGGTVWDGPPVTDPDYGALPADRR